MPRAKFFPVETQSIQATVYSTPELARESSTNSSMPCELDAVVLNAARDDGAQAYLCPGDEAGESHAADGGGEPFGVLRRAAEEAGAVGADQLEAGNVAAEGSGDVVVLAVDVVGNGAADGDVFGAGSDGQKEAARDGEVENLGESDAGFAAENAGLRIEADQAVQPSGDTGTAGGKQGAVFEQADVAIAAASADWQKPRGGRFVKGKSPIQFSVLEFCLKSWVAAPAFETGTGCRLRHRGWCCSSFGKRPSMF